MTINTIMVGGPRGGGLYNVMLGENPRADELLRVLGMTRDEFQRFRDAFVAGGQVVVYTRLGGGNRAANQGVIERLRRHPLFIRDADDGYDSTYCSFFFRIPVDQAAELAAQDIGEWNPDARWKEAIERMERGELNAAERKLGDELKKFLTEK